MDVIKLIGILFRFAEHRTTNPVVHRGVVATTGGAVSAVLCSSGGIRWMTISPCSKRNYSNHNHLRSIAGKN